MSDRSNIEWTDATWNPIRGMSPNRWMCQKISPGCDNCYASTMNHRWGGIEYPPLSKTQPSVRLVENIIDAPRKWKQPRRVFVCSMTDLFGKWVPEEWIEHIFEVMRDTPHHQYQVLTKRPRRMQALAPPFPLPNVWFGTTIESDSYTWRANYLRETPATIRFISAEPLLGPLPSLDLDGIDWLITGGESGAHHRPLDLDWVRDLRDRARAGEVAFFHKQNGGRTHAVGGRQIDGRTWDEYPRSVVPVQTP
jgi:protein gp37